jgi:tRNA pseudouridine32 synthase/23S rRNA pseudouridine746 synthase
VCFFEFALVMSTSLPHRLSTSATPEVVYAPPVDTGLDVAYQDDSMVVVNKPSGLLSVPGRGADRHDCMASRVQARFDDVLVVHRLDMATSGLLVFARGLDMQRQLSSLFERRLVDKRYVAVVAGLMAHDEGLVDLPLITDWPRRPCQMVCHSTGKPSQTRYRVLSRDALLANTRVELEPLTGRSHQLRVHMLAQGYPIVGDPLYGDAASQSASPRLALHAAQLRLPHPVTGEPVTVSCPVPF